MISELTTRLLLVRSGGRCAVCYRDLFTSDITWKPVRLGERAHIVGRSTSKRSPRGDDPLPTTKRDEVDNLLLLCGTCHDDLDLAESTDVLTVERLRGFKRSHERRIEQLLSIPPDNATTVLRMQGSIGDAGVHVDRSAAAAAVLHGNRFAQFPLSADRAGLEIDLRRVADPAPGNGDYYASCARVIDQFFTRQFLPAVEDGTIQHLSVFALARWPLLVYLGAQHVEDSVDDVTLVPFRWPSQSPRLGIRREIIPDNVPTHSPSGHHGLFARSGHRLSVAGPTQELPALEYGPSVPQDLV